MTTTGPDGPPRYAVVDVETSGLRPRRDHVLQIAVVTVLISGMAVIGALEAARRLGALDSERRHVEVALRAAESM